MIAKLVVLCAFTTVALAGVSCNSSDGSGTLQCCQSIQDVNHSDSQKAIQDSGIAFEDILGIVGSRDVPLGLTCSPITVIGTSGTGWYV
jgi:hypothetical protein